MKALIRLSLYGVVIISVLLIGTWLFTGRILQYYLESWLQEHGAETVSIQSVSFNPVLFSISVQNARIQQGDASLAVLDTASIMVSPWDLMHREVRISDAFFQGVRLAVKKEGDQINVGGFCFFSCETPNPSATLFGLPWRHFRLTRASIANSSVQVQFPDWSSSIRIEKMLVWDVLMSEQTRHGSFTYIGALNGAEMKMESTFEIASDKGSASCKINLKKMKLEDWQGIAPPSVSGIQGNVSIDAMIDLEMENDWMEISQKGRGELSGFHAVIAPYEITDRVVDFQTDLLITLRNGAASSRLLASLNSQDFQVRDTDTEFILINCRNAEVEKIEWTNKDAFMLVMPQLRSSKLVIGMPPDSQRAQIPLMEAETVTVKDVRITEADIHIEQIIIDAMESTVVLDPDRLPVNIPEIQLAEKERKDPVTAELEISEEDGKQGRFGVRLDSLEITGDSRFAFIDESVDPVFSESFVIQKADMKSLDTNNPEQKCLFFLSTGVKEYGKLDIGGTVWFPEDSVSLIIENTVFEYPLADLSAYTEKLWGYEIKNGQLNAETSLEMAGNQLFGETMLRFNGMQLSPAASYFAEKHPAQSILPLDAAWGYLADKNGNGEIEVPISPNPDAAGFGLIYFFQTLLPKTIRADAYRVVTKRIIPYRALAHQAADIAVYDGAEVIKLRLNPIILRAGEILPGKEADEYTRQLAELLKQETSLRIMICGFSTDKDRIAMENGTISDEEVAKMMLDLARERADTFQEILVSHYAVPASRIVKCRPNFDSEKNADPRIEIDM